MCGIVGFRSIRYFRALSETLPEAVSRLSHRGPDDSGFFFDSEAGLGFGHRRLSIIDLSMAGHQPMSSDDGQLQIVHNGEIYNFAELRKTLEGCGHHFNSATDTEVALKAYMEWGIDCIKKFVGMFALAIWDGKKKTLYLARDRLGQKPTLMICLTVWLGVLVSAFFVRSQPQFWGLAVVLALVLGGTQSVSRAIMGLMTPPKHTAEFFGFFNFSGKATSFLGTGLFALVIALTGTGRPAIFALLIFFVTGWLIVARVNIEQGRRQAPRFDLRGNPAPHCAMPGQRQADGGLAVHPAPS